METTELQQAYLFQGLPASELRQVAAAAREAAYEPGAYIYHRGDKGDTFYIIAEGKVELIIENRDGIATVAGQISAGGHFGEVSLLTGRSRSLTVRALTRVRLFFFDRATFENVLLANPVLHRALDKTLAERLVAASGGWHDVDLSAGGGSPQTLFAMPRTAERGAGQAAAPASGAGQLHDIDLAKKISKQINHFAAGTAPLIISGESGTGRRLAAKQIHLHGAGKSMPFIELDLRQFDPWIWADKLFGYEQDSFPYSSGRQLGILEQINNGTVVLYHAEKLSAELQQKIHEAVTRGKFSTNDGRVEHVLRARLILITNAPLDTLAAEAVFLPQFAALFAEQQFLLPPLREHKRDIVPLVEYYLQRYSAEYNKRVTKISPDALGLLMKYDWPGNLTELANVMQRAVMVASQDEIISEQIFLGLPRTEGKLVFNLLRLPWVRRLIEHRLFPALPRAAVTVLFCLVVLILFAGPQQPEKNLGMTLCWYIGWPLLMISFFFLPRFWCTLCALSAPGKWLQKFIRPARRLPPVIAAHSGWIMAVLCLVVFWVEIVFNAYESPRLTGAILLSISSGALLFSVMFKRYTWCRYVCPLGALNAVFSMPSILEVRANRQMCLNQCREHICYRGTDEAPGCPMFRHPFLVDNNKDCILCGRCIKNCRLRSTQLNLRLAPQELWSIQTPLLSDSFLIVSLGAIYLPLALHRQFLDFFSGRPSIPLTDLHLAPALAGSLLFWALIAAAWCGYLLLCRLQAVYTGEEYQKVKSVFGYGLIPLILGGYLAFYAKMFIMETWRFVPNLFFLFGADRQARQFSLLPAEETATLLHIIILGGVMASIYAAGRIFSRLETATGTVRPYVIPVFFILTLGIISIAVI
jgi:ferredoxin